MLSLSNPSGVNHPTDDEYDYHQRPIHVAGANANLKMVVYLVERGADPKVEDDNGENVLHRLASCALLTLKETYETVALLKARGVDLNQPRRIAKSEWTPLQVAANMGNQTMFCVLLALDAKAILPAEEEHIDADLLPLAKDLAGTKAKTEAELRAQRGLVIGAKPAWKAAATAKTPPAAAPTSIITPPTDSLEGVLASLKLSERIGAFTTEGIDDLEVAADLTEMDLEHLGFNMGERKKLLKAFAAAKK